MIALVDCHITVQAQSAYITGNPQKSAEGITIEVLSVTQGLSMDMYVFSINLRLSTPKYT